MRGLGIKHSQWQEGFTTALVHFLTVTQLLHLSTPHHCTTTPPSKRGPGVPRHGQHCWPPTDADAPKVTTEPQCQKPTRPQTASEPQGIRQMGCKKQSERQHAVSTLRRFLVSSAIPFTVSTSGSGAARQRVDPFPLIAAADHCLRAMPQRWTARPKALHHVVREPTRTKWTLHIHFV